MQDEESDDEIYDEDTTNNGDFEKKADTAEDFSDIKELAEDLQTASQVCTYHECRAHSYYYLHRMVK